MDRLPSTGHVPPCSFYVLKSSIRPGPRLVTTPSEQRRGGGPYTRYKLLRSGSGSRRRSHSDPGPREVRNHPGPPTPDTQETLLTSGVTLTSGPILGPRLRTHVGEVTHPCPWVTPVYVYSVDHPYRRCPVLSRCSSLSFLLRVLLSGSLDSCVGGRSQTIFGSRIPTDGVETRGHLHVSRCDGPILPKLGSLRTTGSERGLVFLDTRVCEYVCHIRVYVR